MLYSELSMSANTCNKTGRKSLKWRMQVYGWAMVVLVIALILLCNMANPYGWMSFGSLH